MRKTLLASAIALLALTGCASKGTPSDTSAASDTSGNTVGAGSGSSNANPNQGMIPAQPLPNRSGSEVGTRSIAGYDLNTRTIYFDYDVDQMREDGAVVADNFGRYLAANPGKKLRLEGNTDERGSREYNLALAERRTQSVARALKAAGAGDVQLSSVSFGEERPADPGHDEAAWAKNRRVDLAE